MDGTISPVWFQLSPLLAHAKGIVAPLSPWCKRGIWKSFQLPGPFTVPSWPSFFLFFLWQVPLPWKHWALYGPIVQAPQ